MMTIAGSCSVEGENFIEIAKFVKSQGATHLRGGLFKPRSSPYRFSGLGLEGLEFVKEAKRVTGLPFVTEAMNAQQIEQLYEVTDIFQIGTRNQTASELLREFGRQDKPVILKRGMATTIEELIMYADYIMVEGNEQVILCERGIRTFENYTRNTFDIACIPAVHLLCDLPIIADPSHAVGRRDLVLPVAKGALMAGADGLLIEVHDNPEMALTDAEQSITFEQFEELMQWVKSVF